MYQVKLAKFEGPMELLLELIEKEELKITELSLARVADQYLEYIRNSENITLGSLAGFLSVASKLLLIKSRALLPEFQVTPEEEEEIKDLTLQLEQYKKFKEASARLGQMASSGKISYSREGYLGTEPAFFPPANINLYDLKKYFSLILAQIPAVEKLEEEIVTEVVTLEEKINILQNTLARRLESSFSELVGDAADKIDVIISFLAILEMVKQRIVQVEQRKLFSDIKLKMFTDSQLK